MYRTRLAPATIDMIQRALPARSALIEYVRYSVFDPVRTGKGNSWKGERYAALVLTDDAKPQWFDLGSAQEVEQSVAALRGELTPPDANLRDVVRLSVEPLNTEGLQAAIKNLHQLLVVPWRRMLQETKLMLIAPDGALNLIPFRLLVDSESTGLADDLVINVLYSGRELLPRDEEQRSTSDIVVIANPDFEANIEDKTASFSGQLVGSGTFSRLPGTHDEAVAIEGLFENVVSLENSNATVDALLGVHGPAILHVATHGVFTPLRRAEPERTTDFLVNGEELVVFVSEAPSALENPMLYSGLVLAGANKAVQGRAYGIVSALEIAGLDLRGTRLAVLSACETGVVTSTQGEEFAGLRRALAIAGAESQVTSLWKVSDDATSELMTYYYGFLLDGYGRADALQRAQGQVKQQPKWKHPFYWAAFVASGDWRPIEGLSRKVK